MSPFRCCTLTGLTLLSLLLLCNSLVTGFVLPPPPIYSTNEFSDPTWQTYLAIDDEYGDMSSADDFSGTRLPRSCNDHVMKTKFNNACNKNHQKRSIPQGVAGSLSHPPQLAPISFNFVVVEYQFTPPSGSTSPMPQPPPPIFLYPPTDGHHAFQHFEPTSNHIDSWNFRSGHDQEVAVIVTQSIFPLHFIPDDLDATFSTWPTGHGSNGWEEHGGGAPSQSGGVPVDDRELPRRAPEEAQALYQMLKKKCCSPGGCVEKDFVSLCYY